MKTSVSNLRRYFGLMGQFSEVGVEEEAVNKRLVVGGNVELCFIKYSCKRCSNVPTNFVLRNSFFLNLFRRNISSNIVLRNYRF